MESQIVIQGSSKAMVALFTSGDIWLTLPRLVYSIATPYKGLNL